MKYIKTLILLITYSVFTGAFAETHPHFYLQMENASNKNVTISFVKGDGNVFLEPILNNQTRLAAYEKSSKYEVHIEPLEPSATFNIIFTGNQYCQFNIGYYAPGNPKVNVVGPGCFGGGYKIIDNGYTLLLYVTDIKRKEK